MKFGTQSRSDSLIINIIFENADLGQIWSQNCNVPDFYKIWHSAQIEHANYEYVNWN